MSSEEPPEAATGDGERLDEKQLEEIIDMCARLSSGPVPLIDTFLGEMAERAVRITSTVAAGDLVAAAGIAHSLRGAAATFGARRLAAVGEGLEEACMAGDGETARSLVPAVTEEFEEFRLILATRLQDWP